MKFAKVTASLACVAVLASCSGASETAKARGFHGSEIRGLYTLPDTLLTDTHGKPRTIAAPPKRSIVFFGYSNCPDVCSGIIADITTARKRLAPEVSAGYQVVVVTTDPARDTPAVWGKYLARFDQNVVGLTGPLADIVSVGKAVGVEVAMGKKLPSGGYEVDHGSQVYVFDEAGVSAVVWTTGTAIGDMKEDLESLARGK